MLPSTLQIHVVLKSPSPRSKISRNSGGAHFLQLYRKNESSYPHFYFMISITEMLPFNNKKIGKNLYSVYWQFHDQRRRKLGHKDREKPDLGPLQRANALGC